MEHEPREFPAQGWTTAHSALQARMRRRRQRVEDCRQRLQAQKLAVAEIRRGARDLEAKAAALQGSLNRTRERLQALGAGLAQAALPILPFSSAVPAPKPGSAAPRPGSPVLILQALPYLFIIAAGLGYGIKSQASPAPAPRPTASAAAAPEQAVVPENNDPANAALQLVYEYRPPGTERDILDLVGMQEAVLGPSPWTIECASEERCNVSFNTRERTAEEPLYEFEVDLAAKTVTPSPATAQRLRSASLAQLGG